MDTAQGHWLKQHGVTLLVGALLIFALWQRLDFCLGVDVPLHSDMSNYHRRALYFMEHGRFAVPGVTLFGETYRLPLYPLLVAGVYTVVGPNPVAVYGVQAVLGTLMLLGLYLLTNRMLGQRQALMTLICAVFYTPLTAFCGTLLTETLCLLLLVWGWYSFVRAEQSNETVWYGVSGALMGLCCLSRSVVLVVAILMGLWRVVVVLGDRANQVSIRRLVTQLGLYLVSMALVIAPWSVKNSLEQHQLVVLDTISGVNLLIGNNPWAKGYFTKNYPDTPGAAVALKSSPTSAALDSRLKAIAVDWIRAHPKRFLQLSLQRLGYFWLKENEYFQKKYRWQRIGTFNLQRDRWLRIIGQSCAVLALLLWPWHRNRYVLLCGVLGLSLFGLLSCFYFTARYRLPALLCLLPLFGWGWQCLVNRANYQVHQDVLCHSNSA
jgi:4-amino-4-deoxy-L-arabinose transferase-like glycosyltransferase